MVAYSHDSTISAGVNRFSTPISAQSPEMGAEDEKAGGIFHSGRLLGERFF
jgi:hypothetical protein